MTKVDVIIPVYNYEKFIGDAIDSILQQTVKEVNVIVVNDGSTDNTVQCVRKIQAMDSRVLLLEQENRGISAALNTGLEYSKAPFIAFLDADDLWEKTKLEIQLDFLENNNDIMFCFTQIKEFESFEPTVNNPKFNARKEPINGLTKLTFLGKREIFEKYGNFKAGKKIGDFIQWFSPLINDGCKYKVIPEVLAYRRVHDNNLTRKIDKKDYLKLIKAHMDAKRNND